MGDRRTRKLRVTAFSAARNTMPICGSVMNQPFKNEGERMFNFLYRTRQWFAFMAMAVVLLGVFSTTRAYADDPVPDKTGAFQTTPTPYSVPGYTKPDPEKATSKELAVAVDAVAQSASHGIYSSNFTW